MEKQHCCGQCVWLHTPNAKGYICAQHRKKETTNACKKFVPNKPSMKKFIDCVSLASLQDLTLYKKVIKKYIGSHLAVKRAPLCVGELVSYKNHDALVAEVTSTKVVLLLDDNKKIKVNLIDL